MSVCKVNLSLKSTFVMIPPSRALRFSNSEVIYSKSFSCCSTLTWWFDSAKTWRVDHKRQFSLYIFLEIVRIKIYLYLPAANAQHFSLQNSFTACGCLFFKIRNLASLSYSMFTTCSQEKLIDNRKKNCMNFSEF